MKNDEASQKALEIIILQRAKQQAYTLLAQQATSERSAYWEKSLEERNIYEALTNMATQTGLLSYSDCDLFSIKLVDTSDKGE